MLDNKRSSIPGKGLEVPRACTLGRSEDDIWQYHTLYVRCHAPITYSKPYRLYGVLWRPGGHKRTKSFLTLYYKPKLTFYDRNIKATSSYFILKQPLSPPMKHKYLLFLSKLRTLWIYPQMTSVEYTVDHTRPRKRFGGGRFRLLLIN